MPEINLTLDDINEAMQVIDSNNNGVIDYTEFIAACMYSINDKDPDLSLS